MKGVTKATRTCNNLVTMTTKSLLTLYDELQATGSVTWFRFSTGRTELVARAARVVSGLCPSNRVRDVMSSLEMT